MRPWATIGLGLALIALAGCGGKDDTDSGNTDSDAPTGNQPPVAEDDEATTFAGAEVIIDVVANDDDYEGKKLTVKSVTDPDDGGSTDVESRTEVSYRPASDFTGTATFTYKVEDKEGETDKATVTVTVTDAPAIVITSPNDGETFVDNEVEVSFQVTGCEMSSPNSNPGGCHLHKYVDNSGWDGNDDQGHYDAGDFDLEELETGKREIELRLVSNDGSDQEFSPTISDSIDIWVGGAQPPTDTDTELPVYSDTGTDTASDTALTDTATPLTDTGVEELDTALTDTGTPCLHYDTGADTAGGCI